MGKSKRKSKNESASRGTSQKSQITKFMKEMRIAEERRHVEHVISSYNGTSSFGIQPDGSLPAPKILTTEDGIPVNTLYVHFKGDSKLYEQEEELRKIFEKYGPVKAVRIIHRIDRKPFAFISYKRCEDTLSCFLKKKTFPHIYLYVADSWQQDAYKDRVNKESAAPKSTPGTSESRSGEDQPSSGESQILLLNDDCLRHIFSQLGLMDLIALKKTNRRFASIVRHILKRYRFFDFTEPRDKSVLTVLDAKNILKGMGRFIERLSLSGDRFAHSKTTDDHRILGLISRHCFRPHLKELEIRNISMSSHVLGTLEEIVGALEALTLIDCAVDENFESCLDNCQRLQRLQISEDRTTTGACLKTIKDLKSLNVENCSRLQGPALWAFLQNNPQLEYLNVIGCPELHPNAISAISHLTDLSHLACNDSYPNVAPANMMLITRIAQINRLELTINSTPSTQHILHKFAKRNCLAYLELKGPLVDRISYKCILKMTELKELKIIGRACFGTFQDEHLEEFCKKTSIERLHIVQCPGMSEDKLVEFVERNPQLKLLEIPSVFLTDDFVYSVLDALHRNGSFLEVIVDREAWGRLQEKVDDLPTLLKDNCRLLKIKVGTDEGR